MSLAPKTQSQGLHRCGHLLGQRLDLFVIPTPIHPVVHISQEHPNTYAAEKYQVSPCWTWQPREGAVLLYCGFSRYIQVACSELLGKALSSAVSCSNGYPLLIKDYSFNQYHFFAGLCGLRCGWKFHGLFPRQEAQYSLWVPSFSPGYYCPGQVTFGPWRDNPIVLGYPWLLRHKPHIN